MQIQLTAKEVIALARTAQEALEGNSKRLAQTIRVNTILQCAQAVSAQSKVTLDSDDYISLTHLPKEI
jgi:hypothetical protein